MDKQQNRALVHEIMTALYETMNRLLPRHWTRRWLEPDVDAEALVLGFSQTLENLAMQIDTLVYAVQSEQITPAAAINEIHDLSIRAIQLMIPGLDVRQRAWQPAKVGYLVELASYQLAIERLLTTLDQVQQRIDATNTKRTIQPQPQWGATEQPVTPLLPYTQDGLIRAIERKTPAFSK